MPIYITDFSPSSPTASLDGSNRQEATLPPRPNRDDCSEALLDIERAAEYIGMSAKWLYNHYTDVPHVRIGYGTKPRIKFRRCDLDTWVREHRIK